MTHRLLRIAEKPSRLIVGLISGTSADGIDAALAEIAGSGLDTHARLIAFDCLPYPPELKTDVLTLCDGRTGTVEQVCRMNFVLGEWFSEAVRSVGQRAGCSLADIDLIGSHGQTVHHLPDPTRMHGYPIRSTLQIGDPCVIAERTGIATIADFRVRDAAAGGQGAPLVSLADYLLFRSEGAGRVMLNIGGIANVTILPAGCLPDDVYGFDLGPGNMIGDRLIDRISDGRVAFDRDGEIARTGRVHSGLLGEMMGHPFLDTPPPKSTGRETFGIAYADAYLAKARGMGISDADAVATATAFTSACISDGLSRHVREPVQEVIVSGGGVHNTAMMKSLRDGMPDLRIRSIDELGVSAEAKEALAFAILANETLFGNPGNLPRVTGASRGVILGKIVPV